MIATEEKAYFSLRRLLSLPTCTGHAVLSVLLLQRPDLPEDMNPKAFHSFSPLEFDDTKSGTTYFFSFVYFSLILDSFPL